MWNHLRSHIDRFRPFSFSVDGFRWWSADIFSNDCRSYGKAPSCLYANWNRLTGIKKIIPILSHLVLALASTWIERAINIRSSELSDVDTGLDFCLDSLRDNYRITLVQYVVIFCFKAFFSHLVNPFLSKSEQYTWWIHVYSKSHNGDLENGTTAVSVLSRGIFMSFV